MYHIKIICIGKFKEKWLKEALEEYQKRLQHTLNIEFIFAKNEHVQEKIANKEKAVICLDPLGQTMSSEGFSSFLFQELQNNGCQLSFIIGGPEGLSNSLKKKYPQISLSTLTYTHQMTYLILTEQLYRATEIVKGSNYHK